MLTCPRPDLGLSTPVFREALSSHPCLPSPAIRIGGWLGSRVGRECGVCDNLGDVVMTCHHVSGDTYRRRHDIIKQHITTEAALSSFPLDFDVYGRFSDLLSAALEKQGGELKFGRQPQGKVPDFLITFGSLDGPVQRLAELKAISAGKTWYKQGVRGKGTVRRAN